mgnify:CR=1 FL=1
MGSTGRSVLVTGGSRGIGRAIVECFACHGWTVFSPSRTQLDLSSLDSVLVFLRAGGCAVDTLVNNAGENIIAPFASLTLSDWSRMQMVNLTAPFLLSQAAAASMATTGWGRIVNIGSCYSFVSRSGRAGYTAAKSGLAGLTRAIAVECAERGILANCVSPGFVETDLTRRNNTPEQIKQLQGQVPAKRLGKPEEVADLVFFLGSEKNTYFTGQNVALRGFLCT